MEYFNIGIDFGGVLSSHDNNIGAEHINTLIDVPFACENLLKLKGLGHKLFLISFCGKTRAMETMKSLQTSLITDEMPCSDIFDGIYFVKDKKYKKELCEYLNCHFMIDDREDILLNVMNNSCNTIPILFGSEKSISNFINATDWNYATDKITSTPYFNTFLTVNLVDKPTKLIYEI